jgi:hypothetical protein
MLDERERDASWAAGRAAEVLAAQRHRFGTAAGHRWPAALQATAAQEADVLRPWLSGLAITELRIPQAWDAPAAVDALAQRLED